MLSLITSCINAKETAQRRPRRSSLLAMGAALILLAGCEPAEQGVSNESESSETQMTDSSEFVEALVILKEGVEGGRCQSWFGKKGFQATPMRAGFLITGTRAEFDKTFGSESDVRTNRQNLPVPDELGELIAEIVRREPPGYHQK